MRALPGKRRKATEPSEVEQVIPFRSRAPLAFVAPGTRTTTAGKLPDALWSIADRLARRTMSFEPPLATSRTAIVSGGMIGELQPRLEEARKKYPVADRDDPLGLLLQIAMVVGESMRPLQTPIGSKWAASHSAFSSLRTVNRFEGMTPFRAAQIALDGGVGLCRDYARAVQTLFWLVQQETGRFGSSRVVTAWGRSDFSLGWGHAWTWLIDRDRRHIVALDLTRAVATIRAGRTGPTILSALDGSRHNNLSSLLAMIYVGIGTKGFGKSFLSSAVSFASELEPASLPAGAELAGRLLRQRGLSPEAERMIREAIEQKGFRTAGDAAETTRVARVLRAFSSSLDTVERNEFVRALLR